MVTTSQRLRDVDRLVMSFIIHQHRLLFLILMKMQSLITTLSMKDSIGLKVITVRQQHFSPLF